VGASSVELFGAHEATDTANNHSSARHIKSPVECKGAAAGSIDSDAVRDCAPGARNRRPSAHERAQAPANRMDATTGKTSAVRAGLWATSDQTSATSNRLSAGNDQSLTTHDPSSRVRTVAEAVHDLTEADDELACGQPRRRRSCRLQRTSLPTGGVRLPG
jgi:hypothetical protein